MEYVERIKRAFLAKEPPAWVRKAELELLMQTFAKAFEVEPPSLAGMDGDDALACYREFTAACMELALEDENMARHLRGRLGTEAFRLGTMVRYTLGLQPGQDFAAVRFFYRGIGIELEAEPVAQLCFGSCAFASRYTPADCWFMSAFDEGFLQGMLGEPESRLSFECRLTEGAPCCRARFA